MFLAEIRNKCGEIRIPKKDATNLFIDLIHNDWITTESPPKPR